MLKITQEHVYENNTKNLQNIVRCFEFCDINCTYPRKAIYHSLKNWKDFFCLADCKYEIAFESKDSVEERRFAFKIIPDQNPSF